MDQPPTLVPTKPPEPAAASTNSASAGLWAELQYVNARGTHTFQYTHPHTLLHSPLLGSTDPSSEQKEEREFVQGPCNGVHEASMYDLLNRPEASLLAGLLQDFLHERF